MKRLYFFKVVFGLWLIIQSLFVAVIGGSLSVMLLSFGYYYFGGQVAGDCWFILTAAVIAVLFCALMWFGYKPTMVQAQKVTKMDNDEIGFYVALVAIIAIVLGILALALYGAYCLVIA
jgi:hypothetical protein